MNLILLPLTCLSVPFGKQKALRSCIQRLKKLQNNEKIDLQFDNSHHQDSTTKSNLLKHIQSLINRGLLGKASRLLSSKGISTINDEVVTMLKDLHPQSDFHWTHNVKNSSPIDINIETVKNVVNSLPKGRAAGPFGTTYELIKIYAEVDGFLEVLCDMFSRIAYGSFPLMNTLTACRLIALNKGLQISSPNCHQ